MGAVSLLRLPLQVGWTGNEHRLAFLDVFATNTDNPSTAAAGADSRGVGPGPLPRPIIAAAGADDAESDGDVHHSP